MSCSNISDILKTIAKSEAGVYLVKRGKWVYIPSDFYRESPIDFENTAREIVQTGSPLLRSNLKAMTLFIEKFNAAWTSTLLTQKIILSSQNGESRIQFNSYNKYSWLSNFFKTLILDSQNGRILPHVEAGYVAFKASTFGAPEEAEQLAKIFDPKEAKQAGSAFTRGANTDEIALQEMERLVTLKFAQNATLQRLLTSSGNLPLEEHTSDSFWGTANGTLYSDTSNQLGKILIKARNRYS